MEIVPDLTKGGLSKNQVEYVQKKQHEYKLTDEVEKEPSLFVSQPNMKHEYPTYTLQDIMQKLPPSINICMLHIYKAADLWYFVYMDSYTRTIISTQYSPDIMSAAYQMLCWVIENGYLETNK